MNKTLLTLFSAATIGLTMSAATPALYEDASFKGFSADGRYVLSEVYGTVVVLDLQTGDTRVFEGNYEGDFYGLGYGNFITKDGSVFVGNTQENTDAAYCDAEGWHQLQVLDENRTNLSHGITPDGSRICGSVGVREMTVTEDALMQVPVYWDRNEDGTYGEFHLLPHPDTDFFGATPQHFTALCISPDGKTIIGQMVDCVGAMIVPIVYSEDANGEWSYSFPTKDLFNPDGLEPAENPGEGPVAPVQTQFMSDEEKEQYDAAYNEWADSGYSLPYPEYSDYMTEEEIAAYDAAYAAYMVVYSEWSDKYYAYQDYYYGVIETSPNFEFNNLFISPEGTAVAMTAEVQVPDPDSWWGVSTELQPWVIDLASNEIVKYEDGPSMGVTGFCNDGVVLASNGLRNTPVEGYVLQNGEVTTLFDFINGLSTEYGKWMLDNLSHEILRYEYDEKLDDWVEIYEDMLFSGCPVATPDMKKLATWSDTPWDYSLNAVGAIFDLSDVLTGVAEAAAADVDVTLDAAGNLQVTGEAASVAVYDLAGVCVKNVANVQGSVALDLQPGVYVVKATFAGGTVKVLKIAK